VLEETWETKREKMERTAALAGMKDCLADSAQTKLDRFACALKKVVQELIKKPDPTR
jgi:hypothetical protein